MIEKIDKIIGEIIEEYLGAVGVLTEQVRKGNILPTGGMIRATEVGLSCLQRVRTEVGKQ
ncbi:hypothetical protein KAW50_07395 [candidate division WOR-3 bacterium]|nr:hypothetical protein [candidate division WOR-3 bacterium]